MICQETHYWKPEGFLNRQSKIKKRSPNLLSQLPIPPYIASQFSASRA
jgi:hypothetical protein